MIVVFAALAAVCLYLAPLAVGLPMLAKRWPDRGAARVLDVALVLTVDAYATLSLARFAPLYIAVWIARAAWLALGVASLVRARPTRESALTVWRSFDRDAALQYATLAFAAVALTSTLSYGYVIWDREFHAPLVSALRTQTMPFDWVLAPVVPLRYHYLGDAIASMIQILSGNVISSGLALSLAHDLFLSLAPITLYATLRAAGARAGAGWLGALSMCVLLAGPLSFLRDDAHHQFTTTGSLSLCGNSYLCFLTLSYRPANAPGAYFMVALVSLLAARLASSSKTAHTDEVTAAQLIACIASLIMLDEASVGLLGLALGAAWIVYPQSLASTRASGFALLLSLAVTLVVICVMFYSPLAARGGGGPVHRVAIVPARLLGIYGQREYTFAEAAGRREAFFDAFPCLSVTVMALWFSLRLRSRAIAGLAAFMSTLTVVGLFGLFKVNVNDDPSEAQRFIMAPVLLAPAVGAVILVLAAGRATLSRAVMLVAIGLPVVSTLLWYKSFVIETAADQHRFGDMHSLDCRESAGRMRRGRPTLRYASSAAIWRYAPCQPTFLPGRRSTGWDASLLSAFGAEAIDSIRRSDPRIPFTSVVCARANDPDAVCEWAATHARCVPVGLGLRECHLDATQRAELLRQF